MTEHLRRFEAVTPSMTSADGLIDVWWTHPPGLMCRIRATHMTQPLAIFLAQDVDRELRRLSPGPYVFVHDWSALRGYDTDARKVMTDWGTRLDKQMKSVRIYIDPTTSSLVRMGLTVGCAALTVAGHDVAATTNINATLASLGMRPRRAAV